MPTLYTITNKFFLEKMKYDVVLMIDRDAGEKKVREQGRVVSY